MAGETRKGSAVAATDGEVAAQDNRRYKAVISIAVEESLRKRLEEIQAEERLPTLSSLVRNILVDYVESCQ